MRATFSFFARRYEKNFLGGKSVKAFTVCLDPGHDSEFYNPSPVEPKYFEGQRMWALAQRLAEELETLGIRVVMTKKRVNQKVALVDRGKLSAGADLFVSLHSNAAATEKPDWVVVMHQVQQPGVADEKSLAFAKRIGAAVAGVMGVSYELAGVQSSRDRNGDGFLDDYYGVLRGAAQVGTPGVILEHGFHTNRKCTRWLLSDENLALLAQREAEVIKAWLTEDHALTEFVKQVQGVIGAKVDGVAGKETLGKTPTVSRWKNRKHPVVGVIQKRLAELGYTQVGKADSVAGPKFEGAVKAFQEDHGCQSDGEITGGKRTWKVLLGLQ